MSDQFGDGLYRVSESRPCPVDGCDGHSRVDRLNRYVNYIESDKLHHHNP